MGNFHENCPGANAMLVELFLLGLPCSIPCWMRYDLYNVKITYSVHCTIYT